MAKTEIIPVFKDQEEKTIVLGTILISLLLGLTGYLGIIAPLVVYFAMADKLSISGKEIIRAFLNFEIFIFIIALILPFTLVGIVLVPLVAIYGLIVTLIALLAIMNNEPVKIPVFIEFLKESSHTPLN